MNLKTVIFSYLESPALTNKQDVIGFNNVLFKNIESQGLSESALTSFPKIFDDSFKQILKECIPSPPKIISHSIISVFNRSYSLDKAVLSIINRLVDFKLKIANKQLNPEQLHNLLLDHTVFSLHYLVWKYECFLEGKPSNPPRSFNDQNLWTANFEETIPVINLVIKSAQSFEPYVIQEVDTWGAIAIKHHIHTLAQMVAEESEKKAYSALNNYQIEAFNRLIPLIVSIRWKRGYKTAFDQIFKVVRRGKKIGDFDLEKRPLNGKSINDLLKAKNHLNDSILILIGNQEILIVKNPEGYSQHILSTINNYGRLRAPKDSDSSIYDRIAEIEIRELKNQTDELSNFLYKNREVLIPLLARKGIKNAQWLFPGKKNTNFISSPQFQSLKMELEKMIEEESAFSVFPNLLSSPKALRNSSIDKDFLGLLNNFYPDLQDQAEDKIESMLKEGSSSIFDFDDDYDIPDVLEED